MITKASLSNVQGDFCHFINYITDGLPQCGPDYVRLFYKYETFNCLGKRDQLE